MVPHQIEIDDEVMAVLKDHAEAFVDTPNAVLRRLLLGDGGGVGGGAVQAAAVPELKAPVPKALEQILQVVGLVQTSGLDRVEATHVVARHHGVAFQTVLDKYARQLGFTAQKFDALLTDPEVSELKELLLRQFPKHGATIERVLEQSAQKPGKYAPDRDLR